MRRMENANVGWPQALKTAVSRQLAQRATLRAGIDGMAS
jgi:hypothetical protein